MKITNIDLDKPFKNPLNFAYNFAEFFDEFKGLGYSCYFFNDLNEEIYTEPYDKKFGIYRTAISPDVLEMCDTIDEVLLTKFTDGMTIFEYLTGDKPIVED